MAWGGCIALHVLCPDLQFGDDEMEHGIPLCVARAVLNSKANLLIDGGSEGHLIRITETILVN